MLFAFLRLAVMTIIIIILAVFAVVAIRWMGYQQTFQPASHPWFQRSFWAVYTPTADELCAHPDLDKSPGERWIVEIPVKRKDDQWVIPCATPEALGAYLKSTTHRDFLLNVEAHDTWALDELVDVTKPFGESKAFGARTEAQKVAAYLRKKAPEWLFAADSASLLRMATYESMYIESAMDFWPDFVIDDPEAKDLAKVDARMAAEFERRKKPLLWKWNGNSADTPPFSIQGILTNRFGAAQQKWGDRL